MVKKICYAMVDKLVCNRIISIEEKEIYEYGILLIEMFMINVLTCMGIGFLNGGVLRGVFFLVTLAGLRHYTGGFHADHFWQCYLLTTGDCLCTLVLAELITQKSFAIGMVTISLVGNLIILKKAPLNSLKNPKTEEEMCIRKKKSRWMTLSYTLVVFLGAYCFQDYQYLCCILALNQLTTALSLLVVK